MNTRTAASGGPSSGSSAASAMVAQSLCAAVGTAAVTKHRFNGSVSPCDGAADRWPGLRIKHSLMKNSLVY